MRIQILLILNDYFKNAGSISAFSVLFFVQRTYCHCERSVAISRKGHDIKKQGSLPRDSHVVSLLRMTQKTFPIKRREFVKIYTRRIRKFDEFLGFLTGSENPSVRVANLTFDQTNSFYSFVCLLLLFPKSTKVSFGVPFPYKTARI